MNGIDAFGIIKQDISVMIEKYQMAKDWLEEKNIRISSSRFDQYISVIKKGILDNKLEKSKENDSKILWAMAELHDLLEIYEHLNSFNDERVSESLRKIKKGPLLLLDEPNDGGAIHGRNFTFELYAASRLLRANLDVSYQSEADINITLMDKLLHLECKRVVSENNMDNLIQKAIDQIETRCLDNSEDRGIIVISLSKIFWKAQTELNLGFYADEKEMQQFLIPCAEQIAHEIHVRYANSSEKILGCLFHYKVPFFRKNNGLPAFINRFSYITFSELGTNNKELSDKFSAYLKGSVYT